MLQLPRLGRQMNQIITTSIYFLGAQEREEARAKKGKSTTGNTSLLDKMKTVDFHVKAVPGTEVPGHKVSHPW